MNGLEHIKSFDQDLIIESLLIIKILLANDLNYQVTNIGMGNYFLHENTHPISIIANKEFEVWIIFFDGARCKHECGVDVILKSHAG